MKVNQALIGLCPSCRQAVDNRLAEPYPLEIEIRELWENDEIRQSLKVSPLDVDAAVVSWTAWVDNVFEGTLPICDITAGQLFEYWAWLTSRTSDYRKAALYVTAISWLVYTYWQVYDAGLTASDSTRQYGRTKDGRRRKPKRRLIPVRCDGRFNDNDKQ